MEKVDGRESIPQDQGDDYGVIIGLEGRPGHAAREDAETDGDIGQDKTNDESDLEAERTIVTDMIQLKLQRSGGDSRHFA